MNLIDDLLRTFRNDAPSDTSMMVENVIARLHQPLHTTRRPSVRRAVLATAGTCAVLACGYAGFRILDRSVPPAVERPVPTWGATVTADVADAKLSSPDDAARAAAALFRELWRREERVGLTATPHNGVVTVTVPEARPNDVSQVTRTFDASVVDLSLPHHSFTSVDDLAAWLARQPGQRHPAWFRNQPLLDEFGDHTEMLSPFINSDGVFSPSDVASRVASKRILLAQPGMRLATILVSGKVRYVVVEPDQVLASTAVAKIGWFDRATRQQKLMIVGDRARLVRDAVLAGHTVALLANDPLYDPESSTGHEWAGTISTPGDENTFVVTPTNYTAAKGQGTSTWSSHLFNGGSVGIDVEGSFLDGTPETFGKRPANVGESLPTAEVNMLTAAAHVKITDPTSVRLMFTAQIDGEPKDLLSMRTGYGERQYAIIGRRSGRMPSLTRGAGDRPNDCSFDAGQLVQVCDTSILVEKVGSTTIWRTVFFGRVRGTVRSIRIVGTTKPVTVAVGDDWWMSDDATVAFPRESVMVEGVDSNGTIVSRTRFDTPIRPG